MRVNEDSWLHRFWSREILGFVCCAVVPVFFFLLIVQCLGHTSSSQTSVDPLMPASSSESSSQSLILSSPLFPCFLLPSDPSWSISPPLSTAARHQVNGLFQFVSQFVFAAVPVSVQSCQDLYDEREMGGQERNRGRRQEGRERR